MKTCSEMKTVSREDGSTYERCASYTDADVALVPTGDNDMGRRRRRSKKFGIVIPEPLRGIIPGLGSKITAPSLLVGGGGAAAGMFLARRYGDMIHPLVMQYWPISGALFGAAASMPLYFVKGKDAMVGGVVAAAVVGIAGLILQKTGVISGYRGLGMRRRRNYGLLTSQQVGASPQVRDTTSVPRNVQVQADISAWGAAI